MTNRFSRKDENPSPQDVHFAHKHLIDYHLHFLKLQSKCEFYYWKRVGIFFTLSFAFLILKDYFFGFSPLIGIGVVGIGTLLLVANTVRMDFEYGIQAATCIEKGLKIEEKIDSFPRLFWPYDNNKLMAYRGNLISRLFPIGIIALCTAIAGAILALKISIWLVAAVALFFSCGPICRSPVLYKKNKKNYAEKLIMYLSNPTYLKLAKEGLLFEKYKTFAFSLLYLFKIFLYLDFGRGTL